MAETAAAQASAGDLASVEDPASVRDPGELPVVVALGPVDPGLVSGVFAGHCCFVAEPAPADLARPRPGPLTDLVRQGRWAQCAAVCVGDLDGATLGIVGYSRIGRRTADLGAAFGMAVLAYDPVSEVPAGRRCASVAELAAGSDVISLHLPLTERTRAAWSASPAQPSRRRPHAPSDGAEQAGHRGQASPKEIHV